MKIIRMRSLKSIKIKEIVYNQIDRLNYIKDLSTVISIIDSFHYYQGLHIVFNFHNGAKLSCYVKRLMKNSEKILSRDLKYIVWNMAAAVYEIYKRCIVHSDLNPDNITLEVNSQNEIFKCRIEGFDFGKKLQCYGDHFIRIVRTEAFIAPELLICAFAINDEQNNSLSNKIDVYSYGLILIFMLYGNHAYYIATDKIKFRKGEINLPEIKDVSKELMNLIKSSIIANPKERISFLEVLQSPFFNSLEIPIFPSK